MKRSIVVDQPSDNAKQARKRSVEDNDASSKAKKRRHLSPRRANSKKSPKRSSRRRASLPDALAESRSTSHPSRKSSSRRHSFSAEHFAEITLPDWECIAPNIDQILSNKHTQSGVYAHEIHLVQQELEALLSMSIVRENVLTDLRHPTKPIDTDSLRGRIRQHQQAEYVYSAKKTPKKPLPPLVNPAQARHQQPNYLLDRQVTLAPIIGARIDQIWSDVNTYYRRVSAHDLSTIRNLVEFNQRLEDKLRHVQTEYQSQLLTEENIAQQLNEENFNELDSIAGVSPLITHYVERTAMGRFRQKLYERVPHTSPVYKTPVSSPFYRKPVGSCLDPSSVVRSSPRLHPSQRLSLLSTPHLKGNDDHDQSASIRLKVKTRMASPSPPPLSSAQLQERVQLVHDYLTDQHPLSKSRVKRQLFPDSKSARRRKSSLTTSTEPCADVLDAKLSTLITLLHESSTLTSQALHRARLQSSNEQTWQRLTVIEHALESLIQKTDAANGNDKDSSVNVEKSLQTLEHLLNDWKKHEDEFDEQLEQLQLAAN